MVYCEYTYISYGSTDRIIFFKWHSRSSRSCSRVDFHGGRHEKTKFTSLPSFRSGITARARTLASKGGLKSIRGWPVRWNHRVWETDRATRLDRMGSPAKWMREHYHSSLARKAWPGLLRELAQVNCTSFFRAAALRGIYWGPIDFSGEKSIENSIMRFQSERTGRRIYYWRIMQRYLLRTH